MTVTSNLAIFASNHLLSHTLKKKLLYILLGGFLFLLPFGCGKEDDYNVLPYAKVEFLFYPYQTPELGAYGGIKLFSGYGYNRNGVYVCNIGETDFAFLAFDATCPNEKDYRTVVSVVTNSILKLKCPKCGKVYDLRDAKSGLQRYPIQVQGYGNFYRVVN